jgi:hypothetical protein
MKRLIFLFTDFIGVLIAFSSCVDQNTDNVSYPFGTMDMVTSADDSLSFEVSIAEQVTYIDVAATTLDTNTTINLDVSSEVDAGALIYVEATADGTNRDITWGTDFTATSETVTANKTSMYTFVYDGTSFNIISADQID